MKMKIRTEVKIGITVIVGFLLLLWGLNYLKGKNLFNKHNDFYAVYHNVSGLMQADPVLINGYQVGQVNRMLLTGPTQDKIVVEMTIEDGVRIPEGSIAKIISSGMLGTKAIDLELKPAGSSCRPGDTLVSAIEKGLQARISEGVTPIKETTEHLLLTIDSVLVNVFDQKAQQDLKMTMGHVEKTSAVFMQKREELRQSIDDLASVIATLKDSEEDIAHAMSNFSTISDSLKKADLKSTVDEANAAINEINLLVSRINEGQGTLGQLANDDSLYINLDHSALNLSLLLEDIRNNPKDYVRFSLFGSGKKKQ